jgi:protein involved in polysaccharide export with SLBB domain
MSMKQKYIAGRWWLIVVLALCLNVIGCATSQVTQNTEVPQPSEVPPSAPVMPILTMASGGGDSGYRLRVGDEIEVKFFFNPELNETVTVRLDGKISLQLLDDLQAASLTPMELDQAITEGYEKVLRVPEVTVILKKTSTSVYVGGEVKEPKFVPYSSGLTALQAVIAVGGFMPSAQPASSILIRRHTAKERTATKIDLKQALKEEGTDVFLAPDDIVYVPRSFITEVNLFVKQYIRDVMPISVGTQSGPVFLGLGF